MIILNTLSANSMKARSPKSNANQSITGLLETQETLSKFINILFD